MIAFERRFPRLAFARRVPPARIVNRLRRRIEQVLRLDVAAGSIGIRLRGTEALPAPIFAPRRIAAHRNAAGWRFVFLGIEARFGPAIEWRPQGDGIGQLWRMNLHYMEWLEAIAPAAGKEAILAWIAANPPAAPGGREAAWNAYALSLRTVCWLQWLARHGALLDSAEREAVAASLARQLAWLARFPETDLGGNHLIKNIKALAWGAAAFEGAAAVRWGQLAERLLAAELPRQILPDGVHFERSPSYHAQVAADLIETHAVAGGALATRLAPLLDRIVTAAIALAHPDGGPAQFGDAGLTMAYHAAELAAAWPGAAAPGPVSVFAAAGLASRRGEGFSTFVKFGPPGAASLPAHAHGDIGSIELSFGQRRLVVDQGVYEYVAGPRRAASRAAASHNLTAPGMVPMADFFGAFRCGWQPRPQVFEAADIAGELVVDVAHDGFAVGRHPACFRVRRTLRATAATVTLIDALAAPAGPGWASRFLLHPDWRTEQVAGGLELVAGDSRVRFECAGTPLVEAAVWWPDMGIEVPTRRIVIAWPEGDRELAMRFVAG